MFSEVFSIGHSNHQHPQFLQLLQLHNINRVVDVRSSPSSHHNPQFNKDTFKQFLNSAKIEYEHAKILGGREKGGDCCFRLQQDPPTVKALLNLIERPDLIPLLASSSSAAPSTSASAPTTSKALQQQEQQEKQKEGEKEESKKEKKKLQNFRVALMCSEADFHQCHRQNLSHFLAANFSPEHLVVRHILPDGKLKDHDAKKQSVVLTQKDNETYEIVKKILESGKEVEDFTLKGTKVSHNFLPKEFIPQVVAISPPPPPCSKQEEESKKEQQDTKSAPATKKKKQRLQ